MKKILIASLIVILGLVGCSGKVFEPDNIVDLERVIIAFDWDAESSEIEGLIEEYAIPFVEDLGIIQAAMGYLSTEQQELLRGVAGIRYIEPDFQVFILDDPRALFVADSIVPTVENIDWGARRINADKAWKLSKGRAVKIGVIDTGINTQHPDLKGSVMGGFDGVDDGINSWLDDNNHGTYVATVIGARQNGVGIVGIAPCCYLYSIKVLNKDGRGYISDIIQGYEWALEQELDIVNMSLGSYGQSQAMVECMTIAGFQGMATVAAAGNDGRQGICYPARNPIAICVGASGTDNKRVSWSNYGPAMMANGVLAPGDWILAGNKSGTWSRVSGTSIATPMVTGTIALLLEMGWCERRFIFDSARLVDSWNSNWYEGHGLIDAYGALETMIRAYWEGLMSGDIEIPDDVQLKKMIQAGLKLGFGLE